MDSNVEKLLTAIIKGQDVSKWHCCSRAEEYLKNLCIGKKCDKMKPQSRFETLLKEVSVGLSEGQNPSITEKLGGDY